MLCLTVRIETLHKHIDHGAMLMESPVSGLSCQYEAELSAGKIHVCTHVKESSVCGTC